MTVVDVRKKKSKVKIVQKNLERYSIERKNRR